MVTAFVKHKVQDYAIWKKGYDEAAPLRQANGVTGASVLKDANEPDFVIVTHQFNDLASAQAFMAMPELQAAMAAIGVISEPEFWFGEEVETTPY